MQTNQIAFIIIHNTLTSIVCYAFPFHLIYLLNFVIHVIIFTSIILTPEHSALISPAQVGDRVYLAGSKTGTYAQYCLALETTVYPLPDNTSYEGGASLGVAYATAHRVPPGPSPTGSPYTRGVPRLPWRP